MCNYSYGQMCLQRKLYFISTQNVLIHDSVDCTNGVNKYLYKICTMNYVTSTFLRTNFVLLQMNFYVATFVRFVFGLQESALTEMCTDIMHFLHKYQCSIAHLYTIHNVSHIQHNYRRHAQRKCKLVQFEKSEHSIEIKQ